MNDCEVGELVRVQGYGGTAILLNKNDNHVLVKLSTTGEELKLPKSMISKIIK